MSGKKKRIRQVSPVQCCMLSCQAAWMLLGTRTPWSTKRWPNTSQPCALTCHLSASRRHLQHLQCSKIVLLWVSKVWIYARGIALGMQAWLVIIFCFHELNEVHIWIHILMIELQHKGTAVCASRALGSLLFAASCLKGDAAYIDPSF